MSSIGNHDCEGSIDAMLSYAQTRKSKWYFPSRYYTKDIPVSNTTMIRMVVLDVCDLVCGKMPRDVRCIDRMLSQTSEKTRSTQYNWIDLTLGKPKPKGIETMWKIVVGHWGVYSYAGNADTPELIQYLEPLLIQHKVHIYFSGHDHCMQHIRKSIDTAWRPHYFVSGAGGYRTHFLFPDSRSDAKLIHAAMTNGFMYVKAMDDRVQIQFINLYGDVLYTTDVGDAP